MNDASNEIRDPDLRQVEVALRRAAAKARDFGRMTRTPVFVFRDGQIVDLTAEMELQEQTAPPTSASQTRPAPRNKK